LARRYRPSPVDQSSLTTLPRLPRKTKARPGTDRRPAPFGPWRPGH
jgi:hypothetical protein